MKEQLIEKLERLKVKLKQDWRWGNAHKILDEAIQALTSVKSESAEEVSYQRLFDYMYQEHNVTLLQTDMQAIARIVLHDFANNSEAMKENAIGFVEYITQNVKAETNWNELYTEYLTNKDK